MNKRIATVILAIITIVVSTVLFGCAKKDCNGDLDGMWQLTTWINSQGDTIEAKDSMIYYSFQLQMARFQKLQGTQKVDKLSSFERYEDAIRIFNPTSYSSNGHDSIYDMSILHSVGVPQDGIMTIVKLSSKNLILRSPSEGTLVMVK